MESQDQLCTQLTFGGMTQDDAPLNGLFDGLGEYHGTQGRFISPSGSGWNPYAK